jgi:hypothetical protein
MALTVTYDNAGRVERIGRNYGIVTGKLAFDNSYPTGGESISDISGRFTTLLPAISAGASHNHAFTGTAYTPPPVMVYEESVQSASNTVDLAYAAAFIWYVSNDTKAFSIVDKGTTPGAGEVAVDFTPASGTTSLTFAAADSDPLVSVTYWPALSNKQLFDNLVESDVVDGTPASGHASISGEVITLTGGAAAVITVDVDGTPVKPVIDDDTSAAGEYDIDWSGTDTVLTGNGTEFSGASSIKITWIKLPTGFTTVEDASAHSADVITILGHFYIPCHSTFIYNDDNDAPGQVRNSSATVAGSDVTVSFSTVAGVKITNHADLDVAASGYRYVNVHPSRIAPAIYTPAGTNAAEATHTHTATAEVGDQVANAADLSGLTGVQFIAVGYV